MASEVGDILRLAVRFAWDNLDDIVNVWHVVLTARPAPLTEVAVLTDIEAMLGVWYNQILGGVPNNVLGQDISGVNITKNELLPVVSFPHDGSSAGEGFPLQTTPMIQWGSATPRHGSRIYLPPLNEGSATDGILGGPQITILEDMAADILAGFSPGAAGVDFDRVAFDRSAGIGRALVSAFVPTTLRTQRRRRQGVGS